MKFIIEDKIFEKFPDTIIGALVVKNIDNNGNIDEISQLLRAEEKRIRDCHQSDTLSQDPKIDCWRKAYSAFGVKSKDAKSSVENLYKMVCRGIEMRNINKLVDIYNYICLKYMLPVGGEDTDKMVGNLQLAIASNDENRVALLGGSEPEAPKEGEVFYRDDEGAICRRWNWREADRTKLTEETKNAILVIEGLAPTTKEDIETAVKELAVLVEKYCGGRSSVTILDKSSRLHEF